MSNIDEVADEIESALKDARGLSSHQRRLAFCLSDGICSLLERYLKNNGALKPGFRINHQWLKKSRENLIKILSEAIVVPVDSLKKIDKILDVAFKIEKKRNDVVYSSNVNDKVLLEMINEYLSLKKEVEND